MPSVFTIPFLTSPFVFQADLLFLSEVQVLHDITTLVSGWVAKTLS